MTLDGRLPADLRQWLDGHLPGVLTATDTSWTREDSQVWRLDCDTGRAYVKISPTPDAFTRETGAYRHAAAALAPGQAPRLLASHSGLQSILVTELPGRIVRGLPLSHPAEVRVQELAGRLLRRWHEHPEPVPTQARQSLMESMTEQATEAAECLDILGDELNDAARDLVSEAARDLPVLADGLSLVYLHGDYATRNWLWQAETGRLGAIDFEEARHGLAVQDMVWLYGAVWTTRLDLQEAFLRGFGRDLSAQEHRTLVLLTARLGASYLTTGLTKGDRVLIDRGRTALTALVRALS